MSFEVAESFVDCFFSVKDGVVVLDKVFFVNKKISKTIFLLVFVDFQVECSGWLCFLSAIPADREGGS